jgi:hypothetical protein
VPVSCLNQFCLLCGRQTEVCRYIATLRSQRLKATAEPGALLQSMHGTKIMNAEAPRNDSFIKLG